MFYAYYHTEREEWEKGIVICKKQVASMIESILNNLEKVFLHVPIQVIGKVIFKA